MDSLIRFFESIGNAIVTIFQFIVSFFQDLVYIIGLTGSILLKIPEYFAWLPSSLLSLLVTIFGIVVIYKIMGREG